MSIPIPAPMLGVMVREANGIYGESKLIDDRPVKACMCYPYTFAELKELAVEHNWTTLDQIREAVGCSTGCGLCRPYILRMLETGETEFAII